MRRLDRLKEMARGVGKALRRWLFWHIEDMIVLVIIVAFFVAIVYAIDCSVRVARQHQKVRDERTVANTPIDGRFEYVEVDGHEYLLWIGYGHDGITHSPKCKCIRKDAPHEQ